MTDESELQSLDDREWKLRHLPALVVAGFIALLLATLIPNEEEMSPTFCKQCGRYKVIHPVRKGYSRRVVCEGEYDE